MKRLFILIIFSAVKICFSQTVGESKLGIQQIDVSTNRSRSDTIVVVGPEVQFNFEKDAERITIWREWPGIGHVSEQDALLTDGKCVLPVAVGYKQTIFFGIWFSYYPLPVESRDYFVIALAMPPILDIDTDGKINVRDREKLQSLLGTSSADRRYDHRCDFNNDGYIDQLDWLVFEQGKYW